MFVKAQVRKKIGISYYELEDMQGRILGNFQPEMALSSNIVTGIEILIEIYMYR